MISSRVVYQANGPIVLTFGDVSFLGHGENNGLSLFISYVLIHPNIIAYLVQLVNDALTTMLKQFSWDLISSLGFTIFEFMDF